MTDCIIQRAWGCSRECRSLVQIVLHHKLPSTVATRIAHFVSVPIICSGARDGNIRVLALDGNVELVQRICDEGSGGIWSMCAGPQLLFVGCFNGVVCVLSASSFDVLAQDNIETAVLSMSATSEHLACAGADGSIHFFAILSEAPRIAHKYTFNISDAEIWCLQFGHGHLFAATDSKELFQIATPTDPDQTLRMHATFNESIFCMAYHAPTFRLALGMRCSSIRVLCTKTWICLAVYNFWDDLRIEASVWAIAFAHSGTFLLAGLDASEGLLLVSPHAETRRIVDSASLGNSNDIICLNGTWYVCQSDGCIRTLSKDFSIEAEYEIADGVLDNGNFSRVPRHDVYCMTGILCSV